MGKTIGAVSRPGLLRLSNEALNQFLNHVEATLKPSFQEDNKQHTKSEKDLKEKSKK